MKNIICVIGTNEVERSIFTVSLANLLMDKNKVLIIDFDILNNNLHEILGIKKYSQKIRNKIKNNNLLKEIKIQELMSQNNITIYKLESLTGVYTSTLSLFLSRKTKTIRLENLYFICEALNTNLSEFFADERFKYAEPKEWLKRKEEK